MIVCSDAGKYEIRMVQAGALFQRNSHERELSYIKQVNAPAIIFSRIHSHFTNTNLNTAKNISDN